MKTKLPTTRREVVISFHQYQIVFVLLPNLRLHAKCSGFKIHKFSKVTNLHAQKLPYTPSVPLNLQHFPFWSVSFNLHHFYLWVMVHHLLLISSIHFSFLLISSIQFSLSSFITTFLKNYPLSLGCKSKRTKRVAFNKHKELNTKKNDIIICK